MLGQPDATSPSIGGTEGATAQVLSASGEDPLPFNHGELNPSTRSGTLRIPFTQRVTMAPSSPQSTASDTSPTVANPLSLQRIGRAFLGAAMASGLAVLMYRMLSAIATTFANKPVTSDNVTVVNLSAAVRTLVMGTVALGTGVFAIAALGLFLLACQMTWQRLTGQVPAATPKS
jgi:hypothetical protein